MKKTNKAVCPDCGGRLTLEFLYQYGLQQRIDSDGRICKCTKKVDNGPLDACILFCPACKRNFGEDEYSILGDYIRLEINAEADDD